MAKEETGPLKKILHATPKLSRRHSILATIYIRHNIGKENYESTYFKKRAGEVCILGYCSHVPRNASLAKQKYHFLYLFCMTLRC